MKLARVFGVCGALVLLLAGLCISQDPFKPSVQDQPTMSAAAEAAFFADPGQTKLTVFRKSLLSQVDQAVKSGELTRAEAFKLRLASLNPKVLKQIHQACCEHAVAEGKATSVNAVDWSKVAEIIKELLPVILQIIQLFTDANPAVLEFDTPRVVLLRNYVPDSISFRVAA